MEKGRSLGGRVKRDVGSVLFALLVGAGCAGSGSGTVEIAVQSSSCMQCHNGSQQSNYAGPGLEDPHPFGEAAGLDCVTCHGGNPQGEGVEDSHVPPPPEIGDAEFQLQNREAYFNRLTLTGLDRYADYVVDGVTYEALDYLQFVNPGDLRVAQAGRSCGSCHEDHTELSTHSLLGTSAGVLAGAGFAAGIDSIVPESADLYEDTAADVGFRALIDPDFPGPGADIGAVGRLEEYPVISQFGVEGEGLLFKNDDFLAAGLVDDVHADFSLIDGSPLASLYREQVAFTCGDCHLGSAGANNRYGDFRSSGCTACHMPYSLDGRSRSGDPNVNTLEPLDPDDIEAPERSHVRRHLIQSVSRTLPGGEQVAGIDDYACAGCHQGSNRTVMQYWGIRLDQNEDLRRGVQYPRNPVSFVDTKNDERLFDPEVGNHTFNGRDRRQYILFEDYDGDGRDDTPADVHYEAGLGCIDCHGSHDLHGGTVAEGGVIHSRMEQGVAIRCESCHGDAQNYVATAPGVNPNGEAADMALDAEGNPLGHVWVDSSGDTWLRSRLTGELHYVSQTRDVVVDSGRMNPLTGEELYSVMASYAMGRDDGDPSTGIGPQQGGGVHSNFQHADSMSCASCHSSWTNTCMGCHLEGEYSTNPNNFSNITGERIVFREKNADFVYQSPVPFQLGVGPDDEIDPITPNTKAFFSYEDRNNDDSAVFAFSDRNGKGNDPSTTPFPSLSHNVMMPHSIRGRVSSSNEGPRYCVACHLTDDGLANFGTEYDTMRGAIDTGNYAALDFELLADHIGANPGNQLNSPLWVHQVAGLGSGLFLFDADGGPVNPLDENDDRAGSDGVAPADDFDLGAVRYDLDRIVDSSGVATGSNNHPMLSGAQSEQRDGSGDEDFAGPLGLDLIQRLTDPVSGIVLDAWVDADGVAQGQAGTLLGLDE